MLSTFLICFLRRGAKNFLNVCEANISLAVSANITAKQYHSAHSAEYHNVRRTLQHMSPKFFRFQR